MENQNIIEKQQALIKVSQRLEVENTSAENSFEKQFEALVEYVDFLIRTDFNKLISILYRVDVSEEGLKKKPFKKMRIRLLAKSLPQCSWNSTWGNKNGEGCIVNETFYSLLKGLLDS